jgi:hypothetical protein
MSYNNLKRICGNFKAIKRLKLPSLRLCPVTLKQDKVMDKNLSLVLPSSLHGSADLELRLLPMTLLAFKLLVQFALLSNDHLLYMDKIEPN